MATEHPAEVDQQTFAGIRGVTAPMVCRWKKRGLLVMSEDGKRVKVAESIAQLNALLHPGRGGDRSRPGASPGAKPAKAAASDAAAPAAEDYSAWMAREKAATAQIAELKLAEQAKTLVNREAAAMAYAKRAAAARAELQALPRRLASLICTDAAAAERAAAAKIRDICTALADPAFAADVVLVASATLQDLRAALTAASTSPEALAAALPRLRALCEALPA